MRKALGSSWLERTLLNALLTGVLFVAGGSCALAQGPKEASGSRDINSSVGASPVTTPLPLGCDKGGLTGEWPNAFEFKQMDLLKRESLVLSLRELESMCLKSAKYYAKLGEYDLLLGRASEATELLERSLLIEPGQPGVLMDFALALAEIGDHVSSQTLVDQLLSRPDMPLGLKTTLENLKGRRLNGLVLNAQNPIDKNMLTSLESGTTELNGSGLKRAEDASPWTYSGNVQALMGHDNNLNSASFVNTVNLTLPNGVVPLTLDPSSLPQSGITRVGSAQWVAQRHLEEGHLMLSASWMGRQTPGNPGLGFHNEEFIAHLRPKDDLGWHQRAVINHFEVGSSNFYNGLALSLWNEWSGGDLARALWGQEGACHYRLGVDLDKRTYAQDASQNGFYGGVNLGAVCGRKTDQLNVSLQEGVDWASDDFRAGGNQRRQELKVQWLHSLEKVRLGLEIGEQWLKDSTAYSDLLGGIERNTQRTNLRLSFYYPINNFLGMISKSFNWVSSIERQSYRSTISLFNLRGESIQTGLKWEF